MRHVSLTFPSYGWGNWGRERRSPARGAELGFDCGRQPWTLTGLAHTLYSRFPEIPCVPDTPGARGLQEPTAMGGESHTSQRGIGAHAATYQGGTCISDWTVPCWSLNRDWRHLSLFPDRSKQKWLSRAYEKMLIKADALWIWYLCLVFPFFIPLSRDTEASQRRHLATTG